MSVLRPFARSTSVLSAAPRSLFAARSYTTHVPTPSDPVPSKQPSSSTTPNLQQSPNVPSTWSTGQNPKPHAYDNQRFEQTALEWQPNPQSAMGMVAQDQVRLVHGRRATCDGGEWTGSDIARVGGRGFVESDVG
ncbi:NADH dehydrogenase (ubiquinone) Fe-S protein 6 [Kwoniella heveanensis CBS 569]|uniref:NADH dehydrogenase (Ubiquinone) Fe-S protein 6 n=1 Tax=Kwoniella heveanensis BCC8398 TaxID=1296120 RepID=A0A1B9GSB4_9TREE|nr:NADH dehydrogenase (ubiquinone) Fe-S protein 6 [Kwoniella heveanensis BCC8398]OCF41608.1 NADH dehydrogenase (ubiquinone) Fe-S protein 6 [Kwoniella heveanensis CBS 569]